MSTTRKKIDRLFESLAGISYDYRFIAIIVALLITLPLVKNLPHITIDTSTEGFLHEEDPALLAYEKFRDQFGRDELIVIAIQPPKVFDVVFLNKLKAFHKAIEERVPYLDEVTSLINARNTYGDEDRLVVEDLLETFPETQEQLAALEQRVMSSPLYPNLMISEDGKLTTVVIKTNNYSQLGVVEDSLEEGFDDEKRSAPAADRELLSDQENSAVIAKVGEVVSQFNAPDFIINYAGSSVVTHEIKKSMMSDMKKFMIIAVVAIGALLFVMFRRISGVALPLMVTLLSLLSTMGLMAATGAPIMPPTQTLPSFLLAVCVGAVVHVLAIFFHKVQKGIDQRTALLATYEHSGLAITMTSLTTAAGLGSFAGAEVAPIADLGRFAAFGILVALFFTMALLPAVISLLTIKPKTSDRAARRGDRLDSLLDWVAAVSVNKPIPILIIAAIIMVGSLGLVSQLQFSHDPLKWLPEKSTARTATTIVDTKMRGTTSIEVVIDTGRVNGLYEPAMMEKLDQLRHEFGAYDKGEIFVGKVVSLGEILKEINRALNEDRIEEYRIPDNRDLIAQEFLLFANSGSDDLEDFTDNQFSRARLTMKLPWLDAIKYAGFVKHVEVRFSEVLGDEATVSVTGIVALLGRTLSAAMSSAAQSYMIAALVITLMMILMIGSIKLGLVAMIPNFFPLLFVGGLMQLTNIPLDMFTMLTFSIALGLAVDDTVHFMHNFRRYHVTNDDVAEAVSHTLHTTGRAMLVTTVVLSVGFYLFLFSYMANIVNFGIVTGTAIVMALLADFFIAPALMSLLHPEPEAETKES